MTDMIKKYAKAIDLLTTVSIIIGLALFFVSIVSGYTG